MHNRTGRAAAVESAELGGRRVGDGEYKKKEGMLRDTVQGSSHLLSCPSPAIAQANYDAQFGKALARALSSPVSGLAVHPRLRADLTVCWRSGRRAPARELSRCLQ